MIWLAWFLGGFYIGAAIFVFGYFIGRKCESHTMAKLIDLGFDDVAAETDMAYLIQFEKGGKGKEPVNIWLPKSQCEVDEDTKTVTMAEAFAVYKGIEGYQK